MQKWTIDEPFIFHSWSEHEQSTHGAQAIQWIVGDVYIFWKFYSLSYFFIFAVDALISAKWDRLQLCLKVGKCILYA